MNYNDLQAQSKIVGRVENGWVVMTDGTKYKPMNHCYFSPGQRVLTEGRYVYGYERKPMMPPPYVPSHDYIITVAYPRYTIHEIVGSGPKEIETGVLPEQITDELSNAYRRYFIYGKRVAYFIGLYKDGSTYLDTIKIIKISNGEIVVQTITTPANKHSGYEYQPYCALSGYVDDSDESLNFAVSFVDFCAVYKNNNLVTNYSGKYAKVISEIIAQNDVRYPTFSPDNTYSLFSPKEYQNWCEITNVDYSLKGKQTFVAQNIMPFIVYNNDFKQIITDFWLYNGYNTAFTIALKANSEIITESGLYISAEQTQKTTGVLTGEIYSKYDVLADKNSILGDYVMDNRWEVNGKLIKTNGSIKAYLKMSGRLKGDAGVFYNYNSEDTYRLSASVSAVIGNRFGGSTTFWLNDKIVPDIVNIYTGAGNAYSLYSSCFAEATKYGTFIANGYGLYFVTDREKLETTTLAVGNNLINTGITLISSSSANVARRLLEIA